jgi:hypothetical protein
MVENRIQQRVGGREPDRQAGEYVVIGGAFGTYLLCRMEGARVADLLARWWPPRWIEFEDNSGSIVRLRSREIKEMYDLAPGIRHTMRVIGWAHERENDADCRPWGDDAAHD